jgi:hypothetical protein
MLACPEEAVGIGILGETLTRLDERECGVHKT